MKQITATGLHVCCQYCLASYIFKHVKQRLELFFQISKFLKVINAEFKSICMSGMQVASNWHIFPWQLLYVSCVPASSLQVIYANHCFFWCAAVNIPLVFGGQTDGIAIPSTQTHIHRENSTLMTTSLFGAFVTAAGALKGTPLVKSNHCQVSEFSVFMIQALITLLKPSNLGMLTSVAMFHGS